MTRSFFSTSGLTLFSAGQRLSSFQRAAGIANGKQPSQTSAGLVSRAFIPKARKWSDCGITVVQSWQDY